MTANVISTLDKVQTQSAKTAFKENESEYCWCKDGVSCRTGFDFHTICEGKSKCFPPRVSVLSVISLFCGRKRKIS